MSEKVRRCVLLLNGLGFSLLVPSLPRRSTVTGHMPFKLLDLNENAKSQRSVISDNHRCENPRSYIYITRFISVSRN